MDNYIHDVRGDARNIYHVRIWATIMGTGSAVHGWNCMVLDIC